MDHREAQKPGRKREPTGELIGSYAVLAQIANGEATNVYLAQKHGALGFHRLAAIKQLKPEFARRDEWAELLVEEARLSAGVHHANIVDVIDVGTEGGCYLVMDYVEGADLEVLLARAGKERHARYVVPPIVDALHGLHAVHCSLDEDGRALGMVHQAPRARHILLGIDGTARLTDFSQVHASLVTPSPLRRARLKAAYMAPEQIRGLPVDARTDVFIVGITLWEALTGERLFQAETSEACKRAVLERHIPRPSDVGLRPPRALDRICVRALARDPDDRFADAAEMAQALRDTGLNEALYATTSELGQWVRALAGRALIERRRAVGADAPSLEIAIDAFESGNLSFASGHAVEIADSTTSVTPPPTHDAAPTANPFAGKSTELGVGPAPIPGEPSRVTRLYTVAVASPPTSARAAAANFAPPAMTLLGVNDTPANGAAPVSGAPPRPSEPDPEPVAASASQVAPYPVQSRPTQEAGLLPPQSPGAYRHLAADRRSAATLPEGGPALREPPPPVVEAQSAWPDDAVRTTAREFERGAPIPSQKNMALRAPWDAPPPRDDAPYGSGGYVAGGVRPQSSRPRFDEGSLRPPRAAHIDLPDDDEEISSSSGLGFIAVLSLSIIALAGVVGFRQWKAEQASEKAATRQVESAAAEDGEASESASAAGERELEGRPGNEPAGESAASAAMAGSSTPDGGAARASAPDAGAQEQATRPAPGAQPGPAAQTPAARAAAAQTPASRAAAQAPSARAPAAQQPAARAPAQAAARIQRPPPARPAEPPRTWSDEPRELPVRMPVQRTSPMRADSPGYLPENPY